MEKLNEIMHEMRRTVLAHFAMHKKNSDHQKDDEIEERMIQIKAMSEKKISSLTDITSDPFWMSIIQNAHSTGSCKNHLDLLKNHLGSVVNDIIEKGPHFN